MTSISIQSIKKSDISKQFFNNYINLIKTFRETNITFNDFIKIINELPNNHDIFVLLVNKGLEDATGFATVIYKSL